MSYRDNPKCGLYTSNGLLPIKSVDVFCTVRSDFACQVSLTQVFQVHDLGEDNCSVNFVDTDGDTIELIQTRGGQLFEEVNSADGRKQRLRLKRFVFNVEDGKYEDNGGHGFVGVSSAMKRYEIASKLQWFFKTSNAEHLFTLENAPTDLATYKPPKKMISSNYMFPLDGNSAVYDFQATLEDGTVIKAEVQEKEQAKETYQKAKAKGQTAFLLERESSDIFQMTVGNVPCGEKVKIEISYVAELEMRDGRIRIRIPNYIAPKCGGGPSTTVNYPISFDFSIRTSTAIGKIDALGGVQLDIGNEPGDENYARVKASKEGYMNEDLVLMVSQQNPFGVYTTLERSAALKSECLRLTWNSELNTDTDIEGPCEIIFLVDKSGSMSGSRMETTKFALQLFLRSLPENSKFNIIMFDSRYSKCFPESVIYDDNTIERAQQYVTQTSAGGGTNIARPMKEILAVEEDFDYPRSMILLTDGEVSDTRGCIDIARNSGCRVFTIGVGSSFSQELVEGIAKASDATWMAVHDTKDMGNTVIQMLSNCLAPAVTKCSADMGPYTNSTMWPSKFPKLLPGVRETIYWTRPMTEEGSEALPSQFPITLSGFFANGDKFEKSLNVITGDFEGITESQLGRSKSEVGQIIHRVAAMSIIKKLEKGRQSEGVKKQIRELGLKYSLASQETSFVAVRKSTEDTEGEVMTVEEKQPERREEPTYSYMPSLLCSAPAPSYGGGPRSYPSMSAPQKYLRGAAPRSKSKRSSAAFDSYDNRRLQTFSAPRRPARSATRSVQRESFGSARSHRRSRRRRDVKECSSPPSNYHDRRMLYSDSIDDSREEASAVEINRFDSYSAPPLASVGSALSRSDKSMRSRGAPPPPGMFPKTGSSATRSSSSKADGLGSSSTFNYLLTQQAASGKFKFALRPEMDQEFGASKALSELKKIENIEEVEAVFITLLGLYWLTAKFADRKSEWQLVYKKSERWISKRIKNSSKTVADLLALFG